jgi:choline transport protein
MTFCRRANGSHFLLQIGLLAILIPLWVLAPMATASDVFGSFSNAGSWPSIGVACLVGLPSVADTLACTSQF